MSSVVDRLRRIARIAESEVKDLESEGARSHALSSLAIYQDARVILRTLGVEP